MKWPIVTYEHSKSNERNVEGEGTSTSHKHDMYVDNYNELTIAISHYSLNNFLFFFLSLRFFIFMETSKNTRTLTIRLSNAL